jgi:hypothetical protein
MCDLVARSTAWVSTKTFVITIHRPVSSGTSLTSGIDNKSASNSSMQLIASWHHDLGTRTHNSLLMKATTLRNEARCIVVRARKTEVSENPMSEGITLRLGDMHGELWFEKEYRL